MGEHKGFGSYRYLGRSKKYMYVYRIVLHGTEQWEAKLLDIPPGSGDSWNYYNESEEKCARAVFTIIMTHRNSLIKLYRKTGQYLTRIRIWDRWLRNYRKSHPRATLNLRLIN